MLQFNGASLTLKYTGPVEEKKATKNQSSFSKEKGMNILHLCEIAKAELQIGIHRKYEEL